MCNDDICISVEALAPSNAQLLYSVVPCGVYFESCFMAVRDLGIQPHHYTMS